MVNQFYAAYTVILGVLKYRKIWGAVFREPGSFWDEPRRCGADA